MHVPQNSPQKLQKKKRLRVLFLRANFLIIIPLEYTLFLCLTFPILPHHFFIAMPRRSRQDVLQDVVAGERQLRRMLVGSHPNRKLTFALMPTRGCTETVYACLGMEKVKGTGCDPDALRAVAEAKSAAVVAAMDVLRRRQATDVQLVGEGATPTSATSELGELMFRYNATRFTDVIKAMHFPRVWPQSQHRENLYRVRYMTTKDGVLRRYRGSRVSASLVDAMEDAAKKAAGTLVIDFSDPRYLELLRQRAASA